MKKNLSKVIVPTLAIAIGAAIAGSISGTVAWYQYSTRVNVAYIGSSVGLSQNLEVSLKDVDSSKSYAGWKTNLTHQDIKAYLADQIIDATNNIAMGSAVQPITSGAMSEDDALATFGGTGADANDLRFYKNPVRSFTEEAPYSGWLKADASMYVQIPLQLRFSAYDNVKVNDEDQEFLKKDVYLSQLLIQEDYQNSGHQDPKDDRKDLSSAIRVHVHSYRDDDTSTNKVDSTKDRLISKNGGTTQTNGHLDVDGDGKIDAVLSGQSGAEFGFGNSASYVSTPIEYGEGAQTAFSANNAKQDNVAMYDSEGKALTTKETVYPMVVKSKDNSAQLDDNDMKYAKEGVTGDFSKSLGNTIASKKGDANEGKYLNVVITIWIEGWSLLPAPTAQDANAKSAMWKAADYIGSMFDVGFQFAVQAE